MNHLRAFTLIEMLASISMGSVLMALALGMVHRTMRDESTARTNAQIERTAARLSRQFRNDVDQAQRVLFDNQQPDAPLFRLVLADQHPILYQIEKSGVLREQQQGDKRTHRDFFSFSDDHALRFAELAEPPRAVLTLERDTKLVGISPQVKLHVEAVIGQFLRRRPSPEASR